MRLIITSSTSTRTNRRRTRRRSTRRLWAPSVRIPTLWRRCRQFLRRISYPWLVRFSRRIERGFSSRRGYGVRSRFVCVNRRPNRSSDPKRCKEYPDGSRCKRNLDRPCSRGTASALGYYPYRGCPRRSPRERAINR